EVGAKHRRTSVADADSIIPPMLRLYSGEAEVGVLAQRPQRDGQESGGRRDVAQAARLDRAVGVAHRELQRDRRAAATLGVLDGGRVRGDVGRVAFELMRDL